MSRVGRKGMPHYFQSNATINSSHLASRPPPLSFGHYLQRDSRTCLYPRQQSGADPSSLMFGSILLDCCCYWSPLSLFFRTLLQPTAATGAFLAYSILLFNLPKQPFILHVIRWRNLSWWCNVVMVTSCGCFCKTFLLCLRLEPSSLKKGTVVRQLPGRRLKLARYT